MRITPTITLSVVLVTLMLGAGAASAFYSYKMGYEALKGVSQPDVNPTKKLAGSSQKSAEIKEFVPVNEKDILKKVNDYIKSKKNSKSSSNKPADKKEPTEAQKQSSVNPPKTQESVQANFPLQVQDQGVTLEIVNAIEQGGSLLLDVSLKNNGEKAVQFLYSFLEVKDNRGNSLSAITDGLPEELPATGENFQGKIKIPGISLNQGQLLSLRLTDYPDQKLQLSIGNIPVVR
ncbi:conserved hypothetical protein [Gloeothece citriformis PCC 7424]|uniref:DUF4352 domain-containing protein n=1 Tax=Gloeothece citriformis (strain PCC 7424) TaxID=65393 RepID=B7KFW7_GLOC7|nr:hypothetical protein [Gloeothece citriformis]ACK69160.1 conserved hypothetical protein [Gloeothece citriformis PCC 7424]